MRYKNKVGTYYSITTGTLITKLVPSKPAALIMTIPKTLVVCLLCISSTLAANSCQTQRLKDVQSGKTKVRGANLGSWFVLESGISTGVWTDNNCDKLKYPGSYLLEHCLGDRAEAVMEKHWSTWITENDFAEMSKRGINVVRIPVGWWHIYDTVGGASKAKLNQTVTPTNFAVGGLKYLDKAFEWGKEYGIGILLDMHAAPGSQNGVGNSAPAHSGQILWDKDDANPAQTIDSMELYAVRYGSHEALFGYELLNEPAHIDIQKMQDYYTKMYFILRNRSPHAYIVIDPLISPREMGTESHWTGFMNPDKGYKKVAMDLHWYSCFGGASDTTDADKNINYIWNQRKAQIADYAAKNPKYLFIGEWSSCHHGDANRAPEFLKAQIEVFKEASLGWTFWNWKGEGNPEWQLIDEFNQKWIDHFDQPC